MPAHFAPEGDGRTIAVHFHGRLNKSSGGVCWFLDRGGGGAAVAEGERKLAMQRQQTGVVWSATIERGWEWDDTGCPIGLGLLLRGREAKDAVGFRCALRAESADIAYALCGSEGERQSENKERVGRGRGRCGRRRCR